MALSRLADPADPRCVAVLARDANGELKGLLSFVPWGRRGLSLDLMRRDRAAENGLTEFMVAGLVDACRDLGIVRISLNSRCSAGYSVPPSGSARDRSCG
jgi:Uncharacterized conserved protein